MGGSTSGFRHFSFVADMRRCSPVVRDCPKVAARLPHGNRLQNNHLPKFQNARVAQLYRVLRFERSGCRLESCREHHFPDVAQCRGTELRPRIVWVRVLPSGPTSKLRMTNDERNRAISSFAIRNSKTPVAQSRGSGLKPRAVSVRVRPGVSTTIFAALAHHSCPFQ